MSLKIEGATALITGANRGIGLEITKALLNAGAAKVYAAVRDLSSIKELEQKYPDRLVGVVIDLTKPETISSAAKTATDVQIVINNAGVLKVSAPLDDDVLDTFDFQIEVNVRGLIRMARAFSPVLKENGGGAFVQLNSVASLRSFPAFSTYCASKAASYSMTQALRSQMKEQGTQVISVHPGPIETDMAKEASLDETDPPSVVAEAIISAIESSQFHVFPDSMSQELWQSYETFAKEVVEPMGE